MSFLFNLQYSLQSLEARNSEMKTIADLKNVILYSPSSILVLFKGERYNNCLGNNYTHVFHLPVLEYYTCLTFKQFKFCLYYLKFYFSSTYFDLVKYSFYFAFLSQYNLTILLFIYIF